jgi:hypothetical protein
MKALDILQKVHFLVITHNNLDWHLLPTELRSTIKYSSYLTNQWFSVLSIGGAIYREVESILQSKYVAK